MAPRLELIAALLLALVLAPGCLAAGRMPAKCSACRSVADELISRLDKEVPRNHLDLRHRLDKEGKRWGKVIEYKMSELRVIHLLEDLCDEMQGYELRPTDKEAGLPARWVHSDSIGGGRVTDRNLRKEQRKQLENYCHDLLERHEDALSQALRNGEVSGDNASDFLCFETAQHCKSRQQEAQATAEAAAATTEGDVEAEGEQAPAAAAAAQEEGQAGGAGGAEAAGGDKQEL